MTNVPWWNIVSFSNIEIRRRDTYEKIDLVLLMLGLLVPLFNHTSQHSFDTSNQVIKLDYDDDDLPDFVNF